MAKKNWVKVKRGLINDPKHREAMGEAIWLYLHILDRTNYEAGAIYEWRDSGEAEVMKMPVATLRKQRKRLEETGYITTDKKQHKQIITVSKWIDPRWQENESDHTRARSTPKLQSNRQSDHTSAVSESQSNRQSNRQSDHERSPVSISSSHDHISEEKSSRKAAPKRPPKAVKEKKPRDPRLDHPGLQAVRDIIGRYPKDLIWDDVIAAFGDGFDEPRLRRCAAAWAKISSNMGNLAWLFEWYVHGIPERNKPNGRASPDVKVDRIRQSHAEFLERHGVLDDEDKPRFDSIQQNDVSPRSYF